MPTTRQACQQQLGLDTLDSVPASPPAGMYVVVTEQAEVIPPGGRLFGRPQRALKEAALLLTLYGPEGGTLADLRPTWQALKHLPDVVDAHPGVASVVGVLLGNPCIPPNRNLQEQRAWASVRLLITYRE